MAKSQSETRTLQQARDEFIVAMNRDTEGSDRARLLAVLDALIAWSLARPTQLRFRATESRVGAVSFEHIDSKEIYWTAQPARGDAPRLALIPRAAHLLSEEQRAAAVQTLNSHSRLNAASANQLHIGFGALKNAQSRAAVLGLLDTLLPSAATT